MKKITDPELKARAQEGQLDGARLSTVPGGVACQLFVRVAGEGQERALYSKRGGVRAMQPHTALRYIQDLGRTEVNVTLTPENTDDK